MYLSRELIESPGIPLTGPITPPCILEETPLFRCQTWLLREDSPMVTIQEFGEWSAGILTDVMYLNPFPISPYRRCAALRRPSLQRQVWEL